MQQYDIYLCWYGMFMGIIALVCNKFALVWNVHIMFIECEILKYNIIKLNTQLYRMTEKCAILKCA